MEAEQQRKRKQTKRIFGTRPKKNRARAGWPKRLGLVRATSVSRFRRHHCSTLINYNSNLFMRNTFLKKMLPLPDNHELLPTPKETYDLILSAVTLRFWSFRTPNIDFLYQRIEQSWFAFIASPVIGTFLY